MVIINMKAINLEFKRIYSNYSWHDTVDKFYKNVKQKFLHIMACCK